MQPFLSQRLAACILIALSSAANSLVLPGPAFPNFAQPAALTAHCDRSLAAAALELKALERKPADARWLAAYDALNAFMEDVSGPSLFISAVHPDKAMREASEACELRWQDFQSTLGQNETLYQALLRVKPATDSDKELRRTSLLDFQDSGVALIEPRRARAKAINDKVNGLAQEFDRRIRDESIQLAFTEAELRGVPEGVWKSAKRDTAGRVLLGVDNPSYVPFLQSGEDASARERMWRAKTNEGGPANLKLLAEIAALRREYAALFNLPSYADFMLRRRMAESPQRAQRFLDEVKVAVREREVRELEELRAAKAAHLKLNLADVRLDRWDLSFYTERVRRERYAVDQEAMRAYFPPQESLQFAMRIIERLMGVRYQRVEGVRMWHPEVQAYAVSDATSGKPMATLYVDLYPREGKYNHAAVWSFRNGSTLMNRVPQAALVVNFDRKGLTFDELETLLHELGHAVHNNLSATRYSLQAGTSVQRDFVEAPSQMLEDWVYERKVLDLFREVCPACKPVPDELLKKAKQAKHYGKGMQFARQHLYAAYDLALYDSRGQDVMALWAEMEGSTPSGHVTGTMFPAGFSHIASNYGAGYYGYLWSLVVAMDMRTAFMADRLDAKVGKRYRDTVLGAGSERLPAQLVRKFLGREFNTRAFFEDLRQ